MSTAEIEKSLVADAARRNQVEQQAQQRQNSVDYWTWECPKDSNAREAEQDNYWQWEEKADAKDLFSAATIESNLCRASEELAANNVGESASSDDYWSWEGPKRRQDRQAANRRPVNAEAFSASRIEERLVSDSNKRAKGEASTKSLPHAESYWYWEEKPDVLSTEATVNRLVEHAKSAVAEQEDYWKWDEQNTDVLSGAAIVLSLVLEQKRRANDGYWAWGEGDEVKYSVANAARCPDQVVGEQRDYAASYWVM